MVFKFVKSYSVVCQLISEQAKFNPPAYKNKSPFVYANGLSMLTKKI